MMRQRLIAALMILVQVAALEYMLFGFEWFPVLLAVAALGAVPGIVRIRLRRGAQIAVMIGLAVFVLYGTQSFLFRGRLPVIPLLAGYAYPLGWYLLTIETFLLFVRTKDDRIPAYYPILGTGVMAYAGLAGRHGALDPVYHAASLAFLALMLLFWSSGDALEREPLPAGVKWKGRLFQGALLLTAMSAAFALSTFIGVYRNGIDMAFFSMFGAMGQRSAVGFSTQSRLGSIGFFQGQDEDKVALWVNSAESPGYLRGRAYDEYQDSQWKVTAQEAPLPPFPGVLPGVSAGPGVRLFRIRESEPPYAASRVALAAKFEGCLFAPMSAVFIGLPKAVPTGDANGNVRVAGTGPATDYDVVTAAAMNEEAPDERDVALPVDLEPGVRDLAARLFSDCRTTQDKIAAVTGYFRSHYRYRLGIEIPRDKNPLTHFLLEQPPAHCEYFATGAAILLRLGGVPCRYVTGFVTVERNPIGRYWLARNRDAHAWVEAYDSAARRWEVVEATVSEGVPGFDDTRPRGLLAQLGDYAGYAKQRVLSAIVTGRWKDILRTRRSLWILVPVGLIALRAAAKRGARRKKQDAPARRPRPALTPEAKTLQRLRRQVDRKVRRYGFVRGPDETVHAFAGRIASNEQHDLEILRSAADWYLLYNEIRFRHSLSRERVEQLKKTLPCRVTSHALRT